MRPVSMALSGACALAVSGAAAAGPLNPQPAPPGEPAPNARPLPPERRDQAAYVLITTCVGGKRVTTMREVRGEPGRAGAAHVQRGGAGKAQTPCAAGKR
jgi:hypothetical protein